MKFTGFMPAGVELHGGFDQFHVERYSSWEYGDGSVDNIACFVSMRILAWTPLTFVKKKKLGLNTFTCDPRIVERQKQ